ncbi:hypothetical protein CHLNCDRAFT_138510 [Chlorella variabilis]|uniref:Aquaporin n=1 Tax=Chlorella variabilis TaxID=554065 RepID=E1ZN74_CHLVA|nr:hypothetical protein CHLNCDRAFT_138510 [Chlorella variabilis]EFN52821.1 hypothetical protein CHLNCDRAFT_138510 [Chlorella variabilis]|eukprot:XP_005844923.1 hypothetical protein CHLNCDRAFT_138510 [Chlorella variabilis]
MSGDTVVNHSYSLAAECGSEMIGTCLVIYLGESIIANELLSKTKGARMGWLAVALGFGLSFGVVIMMFGYISAHLNPATCLALWVAGKISFTHFLALSGAEFAGAFVGACLVFLHYLPHFKTVPEPMASTADDMLLRTRDALSPEALNIASYDTRRQAPRDFKGVAATIKDAINDVRWRALFQGYEGMWVGFYVFVVILGLGGPTGIAANPARDFSPRLAHALLPIAGKGPSEWYYSWIPFFAPLCGGALAGGFFLAVQKMNHSELA